MKFGSTIALAAILTATAALSQDAGLNEAHLAAIDKNNDGFLSRDEFDAFSDYAFQAMDEDRNGSLSPEETNPHFHFKLFGEMDNDNNNAVSENEFNAQMERDFNAADRNESGALE